MKHYGIQPTASKRNAIKTYRRHIHYVARKHYGIQPTASKPNAIKTYRRHSHYVAASLGSAIAIYTEKLRGCAIADHGADVGRNTFSGHASGQFAKARLYGRKVRVSHLQIARSQAKASLIEQRKKSRLSDLNETPRNPAHCIQAKCNQNLSQTYPLCCCISWVCNRNLYGETSGLCDCRPWKSHWKEFIFWTCIRSIRNCTLIRKTSWGVAFANCTESGPSFPHRRTEEVMAFKPE